MEITDRIYGSVRLDEPVLWAIIQSQAMQRLGGVLQHGITGLIGITRDTSRLEHCLGAMILVRKLDASLDEQIAAVLHDVSHTAFSHVIDYVFGSHESQGYHEEKKESYLAQTDIPALLAQYGYDWHTFLHEEDFSLLEQPSPALCADRLDYFLRDAFDLGLASAEQIQVGLKHLVVQEGKIVVDNLEAALWFGRTYMAADQASWANFREVGLYELAARVIRTGLQQGILTEADLWTTDREAWGKLCASNDPELHRLIEPVSKHTRFVWDAENPTFRVSTKLRTIDPGVWLDHTLQPLSSLDENFARERQDYLTLNAGKWPMRVIQES